MREVVLKKKAEFELQLKKELQNQLQLAQATTMNGNTINQIKGAIEGIDRILYEASGAATAQVAAPSRPNLELVPSLPSEDPAFNPEPPKQGA